MGHESRRTSHSATVTMGHGFEKICALIMRELAEVLAEARDHRLGFFTLMDVDVSPDLRHAKVYVSVLDEAEEADTLEVLQDHKGHFRSELAKRLHLKRTPELHFMVDEMEKRAQRMDQIFDQIQAEHPSDSPLNSSDQE